MSEKEKNPIDHGEYGTEEIKYDSEETNKEVKEDTENLIKKIREKSKK